MADEFALNVPARPPWNRGSHEETNEIDNVDRAVLAGGDGRHFIRRGGYDRQLEDSPPISVVGNGGHGIRNRVDGIRGVVIVLGSLVSVVVPAGI